MTELYEWRPWIRTGNSGFSRQKLNADPSKRDDFQGLRTDYLNNLEIENVFFRDVLRLISSGDSTSPVIMAKDAIEQAEKRRSQV